MIELPALPPDGVETDAVGEAAGGLLFHDRGQPLPKAKDIGHGRLDAHHRVMDGDLHHLVVISDEAGPVAQSGQGMKVGLHVPGKRGPSVPSPRLQLEARHPRVHALSSKPGYSAAYGRSGAIVAQRSGA